jgi:hypothetical protein
METNERLADMFGFTLDELALNRTGLFSQRQRQQLAYQSIGYLVRGIAVIVLSTLLIVTLASRTRQPWEIALLALTSGLLAVLCGLLLFAAYRVFRPTVQTATGPLQRSGNARDPHVSIGDRTLRISFRRWKRLPPALPGQYRVYYARGTYNLLSLESWENKYPVEQR